MIIKYRHKDSSHSSLVEVAHVRMAKTKVIITPTHPRLPEIAITGMSDLQYETMIESLYKDGIVNLREYASNTTYME